MKILTMLFSALLLAAALPVTAAQAQTERYEFDHAHTQILFFVSHLGFSRSHGEFYDFDDHFILDRDAPENSSVDITIDTDSIVMKTQAWIDHLKNEDFFHVSEYPQMHFKSTDVTVTGENTAKVTGDLTMLGQTHPVTLNVTHNKSDYRGEDRYMAGFTVTGTLDRTQWGMDYGVPAVGKDVELMIAVEGQRTEILSGQQESGSETP